MAVETKRNPLVTADSGATQTEEVIVRASAPTAPSPTAPGAPAIAPARSIAEAANAAAEAYAPNELEKHAQVIIDAWEAKLKQQTNEYTRRALAMSRGEKPEIAEPISPGAGGIPYPWYDVLLAGPFQPLGGPGGPFLPSKIIRAGEPAFMLGAVWRNPQCVNWMCPGPSAAVLMAAYNMRCWLETVNLTSVTDGPDFGPFNFAPLGSGFLNFFFAPITFPAPPQGKPNLYEMNLTSDVSGPVAGLPFAGYATWVYDPDLEPAIFPPLIQPGVPPHWDYDQPARFMVYTA